MTQIKTIVGLIGLNCGTNGSALTVSARKVGEMGMRSFILKTFTDDEAETCLRCNMQELVMCKDCFYGEDWGVLIACGKARGFGLTHDKNWFCADGERKQNEKS